MTFWYIYKVSSTNVIPCGCWPQTLFFIMKKQNKKHPMLLLLILSLTSLTSIKFCILFSIHSTFLTFACKNFSFPNDFFQRRKVWNQVTKTFANMMHWNFLKKVFKFFKTQFKENTKNKKKWFYLMENEQEANNFCVSNQIQFEGKFRRIILLVKFLPSFPISSICLFVGCTWIIFQDPCVTFMKCLEWLILNEL